MEAAHIQVSIRFQFSAAFAIFFSSMRREQMIEEGHPILIVHFSTCPSLHRLWEWQIVWTSIRANAEMMVDNIVRPCLDWSTKFEIWSGGHKAGPFEFFAGDAIRSCLWNYRGGWRCQHR
jgi:hypothetical protein